MENIDHPFLREIFTNEAQGILSDLAMQPAILSHAMFMEEKDRDHAIEYIRSIFYECIQENSLFVPTLHDDDGNLCGYALVFTHPDPDMPRYLHKIYVKEQYRGQGMGRKILECVQENASRISLICQSDKISFYEKYGFQYIGDYEVPDSPYFSFSKDLYKGLSMMKNYNETLPIPIFHLNDNDIKNILSI